MYIFSCLFCKIRYTIYKISLHYLFSCLSLFLMQKKVFDVKSFFVEHKELNKKLKDVSLCDIQI